MAEFERRVDSIEVDRNNYKERCHQLQQDNQHLCEVLQELKNIKLGYHSFLFCFTLYKVATLSGRPGPCQGLELVVRAEHILPHNRIYQNRIYHRVCKPLLRAMLLAMHPQKKAEAGLAGGSIGGIENNEKEMSKISFWDYLDCH